jgi:hypothetical protein
VSHPIHQITSVELNAPYTLRLAFADGLMRTIDFEPVLAGELYGPLRDPAIFAKVRLDPEVHTVVWPTGADFDPATLHDWPEHEAAFRAAAKRWSKSETPRPCARAAIPMAGKGRSRSNGRPNGSTPVQY